jgi:DNA-binding IclR family transcriptional regulator
MPKLISPPETERYQVQSVARALSILNMIADSGPRGLNVTEMAEVLGVAKSTALALARTLTSSGYLRAVEPGPRYVLGLTLLRLGDLVGQQTSIAEVGLPVLRDLATATGMTVRLAISQNGYPVFVERIDGSGSIRFHAPLGQREQPHATAAGKAILAHLPDSEVSAILAESGLARYTPNTVTDPDELRAELGRVRSVGFAVDDEEEAEGVFCAGAPIFDHQGNVVGALSVTGLKVDVSLHDVQRLGTIVRDAAGRLTSLLRGAQPSSHR